MKFDVILADPPWSFDDRLERMKSPTKRSAVSQYDVMSVAEIAALDVASLANPNGCVLALWVPGSMLVDGINVMSAWGFQLKQTFVWVKTGKNRETVDVNTEEGLAFGMGRLFRQCHELALVGTSGKSVYPLMKGKLSHSQRSVLLAPNGGHSVKPEGLHRRLEAMFPWVDEEKQPQMLELFARRHVRCWTCVGNEIDGKDVRDAIQELKAL